MAGLHVEGSERETEGLSKMAFPDGEAEESQIGFIRPTFRMSRLSFCRTEEICFPVTGAADGKRTVFLKNERSSSRMDRFIGG